MADTPDSRYPSEKDTRLRKSRDAFIQWAKEHAVPITRLEPHTPNESFEQKPDDIFLQTLSRAIERSSASVVLLSEGYHNCKEMMKLHHCIIQYLIVHCGFGIIMSETGMPESKEVADYVLPCYKGQLEQNNDSIWTNGLNKMYSAWVEGRDLIEWIKEYNCHVAQTQHEIQKQNKNCTIVDSVNNTLVHYCGLDIGGFYTNWKRPVSKIQTFLQTNSIEFESQWSVKIQPLLEIMGTTQARYNYQHVLTPAQKWNLATLLDELVTMMDFHEKDFKGNKEFEWARQSAISVR